MGENSWNRNKLVLKVVRDMNEKGFLVELGYRYFVCVKVDNKIVRYR